MIVIIFEVVLRDWQRQHYLDIAARLAPQLAVLDGFISIERFAGLAEPGRLLSLFFWRDEDAVSRWRPLEEHRVSPSEGRSEVFEDYRLRVASVPRDYGKHVRDPAPADSRCRRSA